MANLFKKTLELVVGDTASVRPFKKLTEHQLIERESELGRELFGPIPYGRRREFFCLDASTWIWYEEWQEDGQAKSSTTRYEVHSKGILKAQDGQNYKFIEGEELNNLHLAIRLYYEQVMRGVYKRDPYSGHPIDRRSPAII